MPVYLPPMTVIWGRHSPVPFVKMGLHLLGDTSTSMLLQYHPRFHNLVNGLMRRTQGQVILGTWNLVKIGTCHLKILNDFFPFYSLAAPPDAPKAPKDS